MHSRILTPTHTHTNTHTHTHTHTTLDITPPRLLYQHVKLLYTVLHRIFKKKCNQSHVYKVRFPLLQHILLVCSISPGVHLHKLAAFTEDDKVGPITFRHYSGCRSVINYTELEDVVINFVILPDWCLTRGHSESADLRQGSSSVCTYFCYTWKFWSLTSEC